ncbi:class II fumarate hydratase [Kiritimatiellaeota bacterium B1221]|nr:class II fumarate hydratase [Kiritimatiellaeota bacterium B1221]
MKNHRTETDSMGPIQVPADRIWGAQTQRSLEHFPIGRERFRWPREMIKAFAQLKQSAAEANAELEELNPKLANAISRAAEEIIGGHWDQEFPLVVFQTGSGTQSNMNANEVIANRAIQLLGGEIGSKNPVHPNDHVNRGQSSNDTFPTAMHLAIVDQLQAHLLPSVKSLRDGLQQKSEKYTRIIKTGRTHLQDATPVTFGQEISAWVAQLDFGLQQIEECLPGLYDLAIGGTAVGTGLNAHPEFGGRCASKLADKTGHPFRSAPNKFFSLSAHDAVVRCSASLRGLSVSLMKIANDLRWLASGPRCGLGEVNLPENEPGSSIMPGKVNPTQCEALIMVCMQVFGNDATVAFAGSQGNFQLNVCKPVMAMNTLESIQLLGDACKAFTKYCAEGIEPNTGRMQELLEKNLMLVTALNRHIGYDAAAKLAKTAHQNGCTLREAALQKGGISADDFDRWVNAEDMT